MAPTARAETAEPTLQLRIAWGSGEKRLWKGQIRLSEGALADPRPLGIEADEPGSMWIEEAALRIAPRSPREYDGVDLKVFAPLSARLILSIWPAEAPPPERPIEIPLAELVTSYHNSVAGRSRQSVACAACARRHAACAAGVAARVPGFLSRRNLAIGLAAALLGAEGAKVRFNMQLTSARSAQAVWSEERELTVDDAAPPSVPLEIKLPSKEGVYDLAFTARTRNRLRIGWHDVAERKVQLVVIEPNSLPAPLAGERQSVKLAEIDPAEPLNPAWWNRFAQLAVLPGFRNKGTLGTGEAAPWQHPQLGEKLMQLGPGGREPNISWEAYPLPIDKPGEPHVLEIDYPSNVPQFLGISIIEPNSSGAVLPVGLDSGIYVPDEAADEAPRMEQHRLIFWPRSRSPLVLLTNRRDGSRAVFGRIRIYGGQGRLPRMFAQRGRGAAVGRVHGSAAVSRELLRPRRTGQLERPQPRRLEHVL